MPRWGIRFATRVRAPMELLPLGLENVDAILHSLHMPQSLSAVYIHLVFSTKDRRPLLRDKLTRAALHSYLGGGVEDHVHLLARFGRTLTQAEWVKELKRVSNLWLKERGRDYAGFGWQGGYADFSVSQSNLEPVKNENQWPPKARSGQVDSTLHWASSRNCSRAFGSRKQSRLPPSPAGIKASGWPGNNATSRLSLMNSRPARSGSVRTSS
jgi:putative transposase